MNNGYGYGGYVAHAHAGYSFLGGLGGALSVIFWVLVIVLIIRILKGRRCSGCRGRWCGSMCDMDGKGDEALNLLKTRYAKGEIDKKEFEEKKKDLTS